jgi:hypothetical protein
MQKITPFPWFDTQAEPPSREASDADRGHDDE